MLCCWVLLLVCGCLFAGVEFCRRYILELNAKSISLNEFYSVQSSLDVTLTCAKVDLDQLSVHYSSLRSSSDRFVPPMPSWIFPRQFFSPSQPERAHADRMFHLVAPVSSALPQSGGVTRPPSPTDEPGTVRVAFAAPRQPLFDMFIDQPIGHASEKWVRFYVNCRWSGRAEQPDLSCTKWLSKVREWRESTMSQGTQRHHTGPSRS
jgi:hypothetical protein